MEEKLYTHSEVREIVKGCDLILAEYFRLLSNSMYNTKKIGNPMFPKFLDYNFPIIGNNAHKEFLEHELNIESQKLKNAPLGKVIQLPSPIDYGIEE